MTINSNNSTTKTESFNDLNKGMLRRGIVISNKTFTIRKRVCTRKYKTLSEMRDEIDNLEISLFDDIKYSFWSLMIKPTHP